MNTTSRAPLGFTKNDSANYGKLVARRNSKSLGGGAAP
jgi:hypothetical protein